MVHQQDKSNTETQKIHNWKNPETQEAFIIITASTLVKKFQIYTEIQVHTIGLY